MRPRERILQQCPAEKAWNKSLRESVPPQRGLPVRARKREDWLAYDTTKHLKILTHLYEKHWKFEEKKGGTHFLWLWAVSGSDWGDSFFGDSSIFLSAIQKNIFLEGLGT